MKYRITSNGNEYRVEGSFEYKVGIFWWRKTLTQWQPLTADGNFPLPYEDGNWDDDDVEYYESCDDAQKALNKFNKFNSPQPKTITRWNSEWKVV